MTDRYKIVRHFWKDKRKRVIATGLSLVDAQAHVQGTRLTNIHYNARNITVRYGPWFDGYEVENGRENCNA